LSNNVSCVENDNGLFIHINYTQQDVTPEKIFSLSLPNIFMDEYLSLLLPLFLISLIYPKIQFGFNTQTIQYDNEKLHCYGTFFGAFVKFRKATIIFVMPVRLSVSMEQLDTHWANLREISYWTFNKICREN